MTQTVEYPELVLGAWTGPPGRPARGHALQLRAEDAYHASLLAGVAKGECAAFVDLHLAFRPRVLGLAMAVVRDAGMAEDVTQEVFFEIWRKAGRFDPTRGSAAPWILALAKSRSIDRVRAAESISRTDRRWAVGQGSRDVDEVCESMVVDSDHHLVRSLLAGLSELQREAVGLCFYGGHSAAEASALLGVPMATFKTRLRDAVVKLRSAMAASV